MLPGIIVHIGASLSLADEKPEADKNGDKLSAQKWSSCCDQVQTNDSTVELMSKWE